MQTLTLGLFNGVTYGLLLFLMAAGLTLVFSMLGTLNFAHPAFYMLGAYCGYTFSQLAGLGFVAALVGAPFCCALVGYVMERFALRHVMRYGLLGPLFLTFALDMVIVEAITLLWGKQPVNYTPPASLDFTLFAIHGVAYSAYRTLVLTVPLVVLGVLFAVLRGTRIGVTVRASLSHPEIVNTLGHDLPRLRSLVFVAGAALAGLAGCLAGNIFGTEPGMANQLGPVLMTVVVIGGLGSLVGAFISSLLIGVLQTLAVSTSLSWADLFGPILERIVSHDALVNLLSSPISRFAPLVPFIVVVVVLIVRPRGLLGQRES
jgi:branched-chain amino acid transport system permease protein